MSYSPVEARRSSSWRLRMEYDPVEMARHHHVWAKDMEVARLEKEAQRQSVAAEQVETKDNPENEWVFPIALLQNQEYA